MVIMLIFFDEFWAPAPYVLATRYAKAFRPFKQHIPFKQQATVRKERNINMKVEMEKSAETASLIAFAQRQCNRGTRECK